MMPEKTEKNYAIIVGGGKIGYFLARSLINRNYEVLLMEKDSPSFHRLFADLGDVVMQGDGCEPTTLQMAGVERANLVVAATGDDADNLVICQMAQHCFQRRRVIARINNPENEAIFEKLGISERVNSTGAILNLIGQKMQRPAVVLMGMLESSDIDVVEIILESNSPLVGATLRELQLPHETLIISVLREGKATIPHADLVFEVDDVVVALIPSKWEATLREFLA
jgi:trk system potassium uptake protein TrkA